MSVYVNNKYRIKRNSLHQDIMVKLRESGIFSDYKDMLMISALIGYQNNRCVAIDKPAADGVLMQFFTQRDYDIIDFIAYAHTKDQSVIRRDEKYEIFSSYANGGFPILLNKLGIDTSDDVNSDNAREILMHYYKLLLSGKMKIDVSVSDDELLI